MSDVAEIHAHIAWHDLAVADRFVVGLYAHFEQIAALGHSGVPRQSPSGLRLAVHGRYSIYFRVTQTEIIIVRVVHSARDLKRIAFDDTDDGSA